MREHRAAGAADPGEAQNPIHLDRVCVRFPELKLCMIHGADPWWDVAIRLMIKYKNLRLMTSAWSPKRLPDSLLHYMRTRGPDKVIFASDWPVLRMHRVVPEALALDLPAEVLDNYLYNNAQDFFSGPERSSDDGPLRTAKAGLQPVGRPRGDTVRVSGILQDSLPDRNRPRRRGIRLRQESVGTPVRHGATSMALAESSGGDGATLVDLTLVAEELGRALAPVPWIDHICAARLQARLGTVEPDVVNGKQLVALDPRHDNVSGVRLIPTGSIADRIIVRDGDDVVCLTFGTRPAKVDNIGKMPMAWVDPNAADDRTVLGSGPEALTEYQRALDEWRVLTAAALVGLVEETMTIAAEFAKSRYTLGVPDLDAAGHLASARQHRHHGAGRTQPGAAGRVVPRQRARRTSGIGTVGVRVHGRRSLEGGDDGGSRSRRSWCFGRSRRHRLSGAGPWMVTGRRRSGRHRQVRRRNRRGPGKQIGTAMDFSRVELSDDDQAFLDEVRGFLRTHVTDEVIRRDRETGDNFDEGVHLALGKAGYLEKEWKPESEGGFDRLRARIWALEKRRAHVPWVTSGTTAMIARSVEKFGSPSSKPK